MTCRIPSQNISVVLQGPVHSCIHEVIAHIRKLLPDAEIILSTWIGEDVSAITVDRLVLNPLPEAYVQHKRLGTKNNLNRLIRSTKAGILKATRQYILKIRSDLLIESLDFINALDLYPSSGSRRVFKQKLIVPALFSRKSYKGNPTPFHLSDWLVFGLKTDIEDLFLATQEVVEPEFTDWFHHLNVRSPFGSTSFRMAPEQYLIYSCYSRHFSAAVIRDCRDNNQFICEESDNFIVSNFIILEYSQSGFFVPKYPVSKNEQMIGKVFFEIWNRHTYELAYNKYCDSSYVVSNTYQELYAHRATIEAKLGLQKHFLRFSNSSKASTKCIELLSVIYYATLCKYNSMLDFVRDLKNDNKHQ